MINRNILKKIDQEEVEFYVYHLHIDTTETKAHQHKKGQLLYAEGGIIHIFIQNKHWYLPARCFMWIPAHVEHSIITNSKNGDLYNFYFEGDQHSFFNEVNIYFAPDLLREMILYTKNWKGIISKKEPSKFLFLQALKSNLPEIESIKLPIIVQHPYPKDEKLKEIASFLFYNIHKNYALDEIAKEFGISPRTLSRKFKEDMGINYVRFLRSLRMTKALELIAENKYNMYEVAMMVGYHSLSSFSNIFFKITGIRPTEYLHLLSKNKSKK
jgi:AraC-like DNA-binding protein